VAAGGVSIWRSRGLRALIAAQTVSRLGSQMTFLALPWFVLETTGSAARMGVVLAVELAPVGLFGIPSGTLVSRLGARRTLLASDAARVPLMCSVPLLHAAGLLSFPLLLVLVFALGCFLAPYMSASQVVIPELIGEDAHLVAKANAALEGIQRATSLLGPPVAGILIGLTGATSVLYIDAATYLFAFVMVGLFVPARPRLAATEESGGVLAGVRFLFHDRLLRMVVPTSLVLNMFGQMLTASLLVLARDDFGSSRIAGVFLASFGAGAVVGSIAAIRLVTRLEPVRLAAGALLLLTAPLPLLGLTLPAAAVVAVLFASAAFGPIVNAPLLSVIITRSPEALRPKVMSALLTFALLAGPVGLLLVGPLLAQYGAREVLFAIGTGQLLASLPYVWFAFRWRDPLPEVAVAGS
jgi:hypothetical protein